MANHTQSHQVSLPAEERALGSISFKVYIKYLNTGASYFTMVLIMTVLVAGEVCYMHICVSLYYVYNHCIVARLTE